MTEPLNPPTAASSHQVSHGGDINKKGANFSGEPLWQQRAEKHHMTDNVASTTASKQNC